VSNEYNLASSDYHSLITTSKKLFQSISKHLNVQTAYVTRRGDDAMTVLSSYITKKKKSFQRVTLLNMEIHIVG
jgi:rsbT co-antagonist protein RsbR